MACNHEGRHIMAIGGRLIDGVDGYACAQYINSAYRAPGWCNKAEMLDGGTIRVMQGRVINAGEEILMAYNAEYWARWAPRTRKRRRGKEDAPAAGDASAAAAGDESAVRGGEVEDSPGVREMGEDGGGYGRRVKGRGHREKPITGKKRGRPPTTMEAGSNSEPSGRRTIRQLRWTDVGREEYNRAVVQGNIMRGSEEGGGGQRFERGEGGGVT